MRLVFNKLALFCVALLAPSVSAAPLPVAKVPVHTKEGVVEVQSELALSEQERRAGLMFRNSLENKHGMLFVYKSPAPISMWMRNTFIPLDILFISTDGTINYIKERAATQSDQTITSPHLTQYVLELPAGSVEAHGIAVGDTVDIPHQAIKDNQ